MILVPSGDTRGSRLCALGALSRVSAVRLVPSAFDRHTFRVILTLAESLPSSLRADSNTTFDPSGDHCGARLYEFIAVVLVMILSPVPSAFTRQMLDVPLGLGASLPSSLRVDWKTI